MICLAEQQHPGEAAPRIQLLRCPGQGGGVLSFSMPLLPPSLSAEEQLSSHPKQSFSVLLTKSVSLVYMPKVPWVQ